MLNVLVIDDNEDLLEMVTLVLSNHGMNVHSFADGHGLYPFLEVNNPDLILMDIYLGDHDGRGLCLALKNSETYNHIPVILYSAGQIEASSIRECKADDFMSKPFDIAQLFKKISALTRTADKLPG